MALIFIGLFSNILSGFQGALIITIIHSFVSPALFSCVGMIYDRYKTKDITHFGRLVDFMPLFSIATFIFFLTEIAFPGTPSFIGELLIFKGTLTFSWGSLFFLFPYYILFATFIFKTFNFIFFDAPNTNILVYGDLTLLELSSTLFLFLILFIPAVYPQIPLNIASISYWSLTL
jgi:NADH-quinone oxidoreductase subunit M